MAEVHTNPSFAVEAVQVTKAYPRIRRFREMLLHPFTRETIPALRGLDLTVKSGELFVLLGPNGAGKTTLIKIVCSLLLPTSGTVSVFGKDVTRYSFETRRRIGYVTDVERSFYFRLTGFQNLKFFAVLNNVPSEEIPSRVEESLAMVGLEQFADTMFKDYSSGMKQKLAIARALITRPDLLIMDEPTRSLDPGRAAGLRRYIREQIVDGHGKTVLLATHNLAEAEDMADRIAILDRGRLRAEGTPEKLKETFAPVDLYRIQIQGAVDRALEAVSGMTGVVIKERNLQGPDRGDVSVFLEKDGPGVSDVIASLTGAGATLLSCERAQPSLEEVFSRFTEEG